MRFLGKEGVRGIGGRKGALGAARVRLNGAMTRLIQVVIRGLSEWCLQAGL